MERVCQFNGEVICDKSECYHCGWDPEVAKARMSASTPKLYKVPFTGYCEVWATTPEKAVEKAEDVRQQFFAHYDFGDPIPEEKEEDDELD